MTLTLSEQELVDNIRYVIEAQERIDLLKKSIKESDLELKYTVLSKYRFLIALGVVDNTYTFPSTENQIIDILF